mgnify:CR=1 FL=1
MNSPNIRGSGFPRLLAKSCDGDLYRHALLPQHLHDVWHSAVAILDATGDTQLSAFGLNGDEWSDRFRKTVLLAAAVHDLGKANDQFLGMVTRQADYRDRRQGLRHEWISWLILQDQSWKSWLQESMPLATREIDWLVALWAVTGHHPGWNRESPPGRVIAGSHDRMVLFLGHDDFTGCLDVVQDCLELNFGARPRCQDVTISLHDVLEQIIDWTVAQRLAWDRLRRSGQTRELTGFVAAVKNCLVAADVAGSALPREQATPEEITSAITDGFARVPGPDDLGELIRDRLTDDNGTVHELRPFQCRVADQAGDVTLVTAGCGSGKTLVAYHWARQHHANRRLYVCYPTTGTATEGYRDYVFDAASFKRKFGARLFHGRAHVDRKLILGVYHRDGAEESDILARIDALEAWSTPIVTCTVDTVLGVMQNLRRGLYSWPALAGAAFVFDEIHAYDSNLFGALLRFIREMRGLPILLMTASLPDERLERLREVVERRGADLVELGGPDELEQLPRYHRMRVEPTEVDELVRRELGQPAAKVLWVTNTVNRAIAAAERCAALDPIVYHSRFRYRDRVGRHKEVIERFRDSSQKTLAICTQVAEMSLDLSATLLVSELAPIPALIQRLGRLNRRAKTADDPTRPIAVYRPLDDDGNLSPLPYDADQLEKAGTWLDRLPESISQRDLVETWRAIDTSEDDPVSLDSTWLDGVYRREVKELRNGTPGITVVLEHDANEVLARREQLARVAIPMTQPRGRDWRSWPDCHGVPIASADSIAYDEFTGASWRD